MPRQSGSKAAVVDTSNVKAQRGGNPSKARLHEGPAGEGPMQRSKFNKDDRDPASEKEPGKSRGPGGQ